MNVIVDLLGLALLAAIIERSSAVIRPKAALSLTSGEGFVAYLEVPKSFGGIKNCWFQFQEYQKTRLDLNTSTSITTGRGEVILPFSNDTCGIRVHKLSPLSEAFWTLEAENAFGDSEKAAVQISILSAAPQSTETHVQRDVGQSTLTCAQYKSYTKHCKIIDESSAESWDQCELYAMITPNKTFECLTYNWGRMAANSERIIVEPKTPASTKSVKASTEDGDGHVVLRCQFPDTIYSCQAEKPDSKDEFFIMDGLYNGRYSAYDTTISSSRCSFEIPKPFEKSEMGLWRIMSYDSKTTPAGCLFYVGGNKTDIIARELEKIQDKIMEIKLYAPEVGSTSNSKIDELFCAVPFVIDDCYLKDPNNTIYFPDSLRFQSSRFYGRCAFTNMPVIAGTWMCGVRGRDNDREVVQDIQVTVKPKNGEVLTEQVRTKRDTAVELMCRSPYEEPLTHCAFMDPQGRVHLVATANSVKAKGHVRYFGRGLQFGDCGVNIEEINSQDFGEWKCHFIIAVGQRVSTFAIQLAPSAVAQATSIGLGVGLSIIGIMILAVVVGTIIYRRRHLSAQHTFAQSEGLGLSVMSVATAATRD